MLSHQHMFIKEIQANEYSTGPAVVIVVVVPYILILILIVSCFMFYAERVPNIVEYLQRVFMTFTEMSHITN